MSTLTLTLDDALALGITAARLRHNKTLPTTVPGPANADGTPGADVPNPDLIADDASYVQSRMAAAVQSWYDTNQDAFRIPTGDWLQRWTAEERKAIRAMGAGSAQVQAWLDDLDASTIVKLSDPRVTQGVPAVAQALVQAGVIAPDMLQSRLDAVTALSV